MVPYAEPRNNRCHGAPGSARAVAMNGRSTVRMTQNSGVGGFNGKEPPWFNQSPRLGVDVNVGEVDASSRLEEEKVYSWLYALALSRNSLTFDYVESTERGGFSYMSAQATSANSQ
ncbi:hypothetical protein Droror1_Dr00012300 [Drosera rotundifolia]